jgi:hypothetical protein
VEERLLKPKTRLAGFDLIRLISFFIISVYHFLYAVWRGRAPIFETTMATEPFFSHVIYPMLRSFSFSGHTIMFMSTMLIALARKSLGRTLRFSSFLLLAWVGFVWAEGDFHSFEPFWDVHVLLLLGLVTIAIADQISSRFAIALGVLGFLSTWIPFWELSVFRSLPFGLRESLVGDCESGYSSWPILPWLGFLWCGYGLGLLVRIPSVRERVSKISKLESYAWAAVLFLSLFHLGGFYRLDALDMWECGAFRLPPLEFWSHFAWVLFTIRLSLLTTVNEWLTRHFTFLRKLNVSKNFFLAYALQYVLGFAVALALGDFLRSHPLAFTLAGLMMLPSAELLAWLGVRFGARSAFKGRPS